MKQINSQKIQNKLRNKFIKSGVKMIGPETIFFSQDTKIGKNVVIEPYVVIGPKVKIGNNVSIKSFSHIEETKIERNVVIGPYARLRPGTVLKSGAKIGNFVETKKSVIGKNSKVNHLSYVGDTTIGKGSNIGAGTITCNYDGVNKNKTNINTSYEHSRQQFRKPSKTFKRNEQHYSRAGKTVYDGSGWQSTKSVG